MLLAGRLELGLSMCSESVVAVLGWLDSGLMICSGGVVAVGDEDLAMPVAGLGLMMCCEDVVAMLKVAGGEDLGLLSGRLELGCMMCSDGVVAELRIELEGWIELGLEVTVVATLVREVVGALLLVGSVRVVGGSVDVVT